jgi:hypothetical protein
VKAGHLTVPPSTILCEVVSVGVQLGGHGRIVHGILVSDVAQRFLVTMGGHLLPPACSERSMGDRSQEGNSALRGRFTTNAAPLAQASPSATPAATSLG